MAVNKEKYSTLIKELKEKNVTLVAVSKFKTAADILALYEVGHRDFGENYVQELVDKYETLPKDIRWHFIGHLQSNKVKYIAPFVHLIHGVDSFKLLKEIEKQATKISRNIDVLLQMHIAQEETKFGFDENELRDLIEKLGETPLQNTVIKGFMGMASFTDDVPKIKQEFTLLKGQFDAWAASFDISQHAVKKQSRIFKSILKLDRNFHIYIHGNTDLIEKGIDDDGRKFYKLYYQDEA